MTLAPVADRLRTTRLSMRGWVEVHLALGQVQLDFQCWGRDHWSRDWIHPGGFPPDLEWGSGLAELLASWRTHALKQLSGVVSIQRYADAAPSRTGRKPKPESPTWRPKSKRQIVVLVLLEPSHPASMHARKPKNVSLPYIGACRVDSFIKVCTTGKLYQ